MIDTDTIVIGTGPSALGFGVALEGTALSKALLFVDKARGVGGRIATRRLFEAEFNHGVTRLEASQGSVFSEWIDRQSFPLEREGELLRPGRGLTALVKPFFSGQQVQLETEVDRIVRSSSDDMFLLEVKGRGQELCAKRVVVTAPLPQVLNLVRDLKGVDRTLRARLEAVRYLPSIVLLGRHPDPEIFLSEEQGQVEFFESGSGLGTFLLRWNAEFSAEIFEKEEDEIRSACITHLPGLREAEFHVKKWRFAFVKNPLQVSFLEFVPGLWIVGDGCVGSSVQRCFDSGYELASRFC